MRIIGNLLWWLFGGLEAAIGYFTGSLVMACTIIGIPIALQTFKIGLRCLWPFGAEVSDGDSPSGCITLPLNVIWIVFWWFVGMANAYLLWNVALHYHHWHSIFQATFQDGRSLTGSVRQGR